MPKYHNCEQYSDEWDRLHLGIPTSSSFKKIITPEGKPSKQWETYAYHLIAERWLKRPVNTYTSPAMEHGKEWEESAVEYYELMTGRKCDRIGFVTNDESTIGCSPDRLIDDDGLLEVKCPQPQTQIKYLLTGEIDKEYWPQLQGQLFITGRKWVDIIAYNPEIFHTIVRVERDVEYIACMEKLLGDVTSFIDRIMEKIAIMRNQKGEQSNVSPQIQF